MGRFSRGDHLFTSRMVGLNVLLEIKRKIGDPWGTVQEKPFKTEVEEWRSHAKNTGPLFTGRPSMIAAYLERRLHRPLVTMPSMPHRLADLLPEWVEDPDPMQALINEMRQHLNHATWYGDSDFWTIKFTTPNREPDGPPSNDDWHNRTKQERRRPCNRQAEVEDAAIPDADWARAWGLSPWATGIYNRIRP